MRSRRRILLLLSMLLLGLVAPVAPAVQAQTATPTLVAIRAAHHPGYDRVVFEFRGALPATRTASYVPTLVGDASGLPVPLVGTAKLRLVMKMAQGHNDAGVVTYGPTRRTYALPNVIQVVNAGDFEGVLTFGIGLARRATVSMFTLRSPSRVVLDIRTPFTTVPVKVYFLNTRNFNVGREPYVTGVTRPVIPPAVAGATLQRMFAGPTQAEYAAGLRFVASGATGYRNLSIVNRVARVTLTGRCSSGGSTFTIAGEIMPALKQFPTVRWVKIYDQLGRTEQPTGYRDSIPECLEP